jgi:hypothetical protein
VDVVARCGWHDSACQVTACGARDECAAYAAPYICECGGTGFAGAQCADDVDECLQRDACLHGGVCQNTVGGFLCLCQGTGYHGDRCDVDNDECSDASGSGNVTTSNVCFNGGIDLLFYNVLFLIACIFF